MEMKEKYRKISNYFGLAQILSFFGTMGISLYDLDFNPKSLGIHFFTGCTINMLSFLGYIFFRKKSRRKSGAEIL